jgi:hypothetical protein
MGYKEQHNCGLVRKRIKPTGEAAMHITKILTLLLLMMTWMLNSPAYAASGGCIGCHKGIEQIREEGSSPSNEYTASDARTKFNADWAGVAVMDVSRDFSDEYDQLLLLALHKNNASVAYVIVLFDDYAAVKAEINAVLDSLKFRSQDGIS